MNNNLGQRLTSGQKRLRGVSKIIATAAQKPEMAKICAPFTSKKTSLPNNKHRAPNSWTKQLFRAIQTGDLGLASQAIANGADVNKFNKRGLAPLHLATKCRPETEALITMLVDGGAAIDGADKQRYVFMPKRLSPLIKAIQSHCQKSVAILLKYGANPNFADQDGLTALHHIASSWQEEKMATTIDLLLAAGADINQTDKHGRTPLMLTAYAFKKDWAPETIFLARGANPNLTDTNGNTFLHQLATGSSSRNIPPIITNLIDAEATLNTYNHSGKTPLMVAIKKNKYNLAKQLLAAGVSPNQINKYGDSLLYSAVSCQPEKLELLKALLAGDCDVDIRNKDKETALHYALSSAIKCLEPAQLLLTAGADPNILNQYEATPLHKFVSQKNSNPETVLTLMLKHGADLNIKDKGGNTPLLLAAEYSSGFETMRAFIKAGANPKVSDIYGNSLLHKVVRNTNPGIVERINLALEVTTNINKVNTDGKTAKDIVLRSGNREVMEIFKFVQI